jgi:transcriptional regulator with XRE-family HTH domain
MDDQQFGRLIRAIRMRRGQRQVDLAAATGVSHATISLLERGHCSTLSLEKMRGIAAGVDVRLELAARWRGGDADRLVSRRHSLLAESFASFMTSATGWMSTPEVSFAIYGERGIIDQLAWHPATRHLLVIELKTEFVDVNELLGTLDRKARLGPDHRSRARLDGWAGERVGRCGGHSNEPAPCGAACGASAEPAGSGRAAVQAVSAQPIPGYIGSGVLDRFKPG